MPMDHDILQRVSAGTGGRKIKLLSNYTLPFIQFFVFDVFCEQYIIIYMVHVYMHTYTDLASYSAEPRVNLGLTLP